MRAFEFLKEAEEQESPDSPDVENLKSTLASKIKELPTDEKTQKILQEIEELLASIGAGSRSEVVKNSLQLINDAEVNKAQKLLAKYFMSLDADPKSKQAMLDAWKADNLVDVKKLVTPGSHTIEDVIIGYSTNPAIQEMTDDLSQISFLGQGKGEFLLSVFSKKISKAGKGDLNIDGIGSVEVKTNDVGAGRFYDQQVRPSTDYQGSVNDFRKIFAQEIEEQKVMSTTGISITGLVKLHNALPVDKKDDFKSLLKNVMSNLFTATPELSDPVVDSIVVGNENQAKQRYAIANLNNYMAQKDDVGILMINLAKNPYEFIFFTDNKSLNDGGLRLHTSTAYPITNDPRNAYPQTKVQATSQEQ